MSNLKMLILAGGKSSRMGRPKYLLELDGEPNFLRLIRQAQIVCPGVATYLSLREQSGVKSLADDSRQRRKEPYYQYLFDQLDDIGPAAGLLAAYDADPICRWLVIACDFPLLTSTDIRRLLDNYEAPVTCFVNEDGFPEPLLAVWSSVALSRLRENIEAGFSGPSQVIKQLGGKTIRSSDATALLNTNTPEEWEFAERIAYSK